MNKKKKTIDDIKNMLEHSEKDIVLRWAILLQGLEYKNVEKADKIMKKYKFDNITRKDILWLIKHQDIFNNWKDLSHKQKNKIMTHQSYPKLLKIFKILGTSYNDDEVTSETLGLYDKKAAEFNELVKDQDKFQQMKQFNIVTGDDLISLGIKPGPIHGEILGDLIEKYSSGEMKTRQELLDYIKNKYVNNTLSDGTVIDSGV